MKKWCYFILPNFLCHVDKVSKVITSKALKNFNYFRQMLPLSSYLGKKIAKHIIMKYCLGKKIAENSTIIKSHLLSANWGI